MRIFSRHICCLTQFNDVESNLFCDLQIINTSLSSTLSCFMTSQTAFIFYKFCDLAFKCLFKHSPDYFKNTLNKI